MDQMIVRLENERGDLLHETHIPCRHRSELPRSITWGGHMFHLREDTEVSDGAGNFSAIYREGKHLDIPQANAEVGGDGVTVIRAKPEAA